LGLQGYWGWLRFLYLGRTYPLPDLAVTNCANNRILGQQVVVENQGGAGGTIAANAVTN
jgi:hypothetical protein